METNVPQALAFYFCLQYPQHFKHASSQALAWAANTSLPFCKAVNIAGHGFPPMSKSGSEVHINGGFMAASVS